MTKFRVTETAKKPAPQFPTQGPAGFSFSIEERGVGIASGEYSRVLEFTYENEDEAKNAETAIKNAIAKASHLQK